MSKGNKEEQKWLLGESLNQYDRSLKEELNKVEKRNREQNHKISALINAFDDDYIKKEEENTNISLDYSKEGIIIVDDIKGNTLVNNVKDSNKELVLNGDIDTQGINNVILEGTVDNGKVDVSLEGNTEINLSKTKDPIMITHKFDDINSNNGKLQTTVNETTTVNDSPGKVDIKEITGDTLINHVSNGSDELTLNGDIDTSGYNNVTITEGINGGKVDVMCEGNTMVNVCDQEDPVAITKNYEVTTGNHIALQGEYDGKCRPNIYGNTLVNLVENAVNITIDGNNLHGITLLDLSRIKTNQLYTVIIKMKNNTLDKPIRFSAWTVYNGYTVDNVAHYYHEPMSSVKANDRECFGSKQVGEYKTLIGISNMTDGKSSSVTLFVDSGVTGSATYDVMILEGDYTNKPIPEYFTGMKSSFEDKLVPENLYKFSSGDDFYSLDGGTTLDGEYIKMTANSNYQNAMLKPLSTIKPSTTYTIAVDVVENTLNSRLVITINKSDTQLSSAETIQINAGKTGIFTYVVTTSSDLSSCVRCLVNFLDKTNTTGSVKYRIMVVEGNYTKYDFTNYDSSKGGKYKVDYKVTGKNLIAFTELGDILNKAGEDASSTTIMRTSYIFLKANHTYYITNPAVEGSEWFSNIRYDRNKNFIGETYENNETITPKEDMYLRIKKHNPNQLPWQIQLEEGTTATTYEPYKESIKTLYLNSPLLEGDTIEQSGNNIIHMHKYGKVVLDGSNYVPIREQILTTSDSYRWTFVIPNIKNSIDSTTGLGICDKYPIVTPKDTWNSIEGITQNNSGNKIVFYLDRYKNGSDTSKQALIKELSTNPITFVYELATPTREVISTNDNLLLDSYVNGHLDMDTIIPIDKVAFKTYYKPLKYLSPNTEYTIQFESDNNGILYGLNINNKDSLTNLKIVKGINKFTITTSAEIVSYYLWTNGIGFNASKVVVTPKVDGDFGYFKGMKSVGEDDVNGNKIEILSSKNIAPSSKVIYTVSGIEFNFGSSIINENVYVHNISDKRIMVHTSINGKYSRGFMIIKNSKKLIELNEGEVIYCASVNYTDGWSNSNVEKARNSFIITKKENELNKKEILMNEPLRGLPNGVKDKYVIIDGKWYIERNCGNSILDINMNWQSSSANTSNYCVAFVNETNAVNLASSNILSDTLPHLNSFSEAGKRKGIYLNDNNYSKNGNIVVSVPISECNSLSGLNGVKYWLRNNLTTVVYPKNTIIYEPIDYNPFEVYTDITHISNNSIIPCNMIIKNSGYNTISLKENTKYTAYVNNKNNISLAYKIDNNAIAVNSSNKFTFTTPSTLVDRTIRIASKGSKIENLMIIEETPQNDPIGYFNGLKSSYECEKVTDVNDEHFGKYKVDVNVKGENFESAQTVYLNSPLLKGDKIIWKDNKLQHYHKMNTIVFDGSDDEGWFRQEALDTNNTERYYIPDTTVKLNSPMISDVLPTAISGERDNLTHLYIHNEVKRFDIKKLKTDTRWNDIATLKKWLQQNPITVVYELATPYYEVISEYPLKFNSIANCSLSTISNIQVSNISFNIYEETLPYLYNNKKYYITFNSDISKEIIINLGGSELVYTTKVGFNKVEITTPDNSNNMLTFNGQGVNINNVKVTQQNIDDYFEGMKSVGECEDLEIVSNNDDNTLSNKQTMAHEPLRGLPNGVKDKYVMIDSKWYIERNCAQVNMAELHFAGDTNNTMKVLLFDNSKPIAISNIFSNQNNYDSLTKGQMFVQGRGGGLSYIWIPTDSMSNEEFKKFLNEKNAKLVYQLAQPTYEPIDYNPFEVYTNITHISNNSLIPCNMVIKNTGYNCILKPSTKYTVVTNTQNSISAKIGSTKVDSTNNVFTIITPSTLTDNVLRFSGKGLTTRNIMLLEGDKTNYIPGYFTGMESAFEQELVTDEKDKNYGKYKVNVKVVGKNLLDASKGVINSSFGNSETICIKVKPNTAYTYSSSVYKGAISIYELSFIVDNNINANKIGDLSYKSDSITDGKSFTTSSLTNYLFMNYDTASNIQIEQGNTATEYEPYKENNITFYLKEPLRGVGDIKDKVYIKEDKVVVERNCASVTFDGSEKGWLLEFENGSSRFGLYNITNINMKQNGAFLCALYYPHAYAYKYNSFHFMQNGVRFNNDNHKFTTVSQWTQWLQANPTTVVYQLATPVYEEVECDLSKLMLENYENSSLILNSNIPPTVDVRYKGELPIVSATKELSSNVESTTTDINQNIIPYMCDMDYRIVELQLKNASTQGLEVNVLGLDSEDVLLNNRKANKIFNPSYEMLKRDILSKRYSSDEYKYRLERYLLADKISNEEYNELEELINGR